MKFVNKNETKLSEYAVSASDALKRRREPHPPLYLDVRSAEDYKTGHLAGSNLIPAEFLEEYLFQLPPFAHITVIGGSDDEATGKAIQLMHDNGFNDVSFVPGGYAAVLAALRADQSEIFLQDMPSSEWSSRIEQVLNERVRPALASDGGGLTLLKVDLDKVYIQYQGACTGCSSSTAGTLRFIQSALRTALNHDIEVIAA